MGGGRGRGGQKDSHDVDIIIGGGYLMMMMLDYKGDRGFKNLGKSNYIVCECSLKSNLIFHA